MTYVNFTVITQSQRLQLLDCHSSSCSSHRAECDIILCYSRFFVELSHTSSDLIGGINGRLRNADEGSTCLCFNLQPLQPQHAFSDDKQYILSNSKNGLEISVSFSQKNYENLTKLNSVFYEGRYRESICVWICEPLISMQETILHITKVSVIFLSTFILINY